MSCKHDHELHLTVMAAPYVKEACSRLGMQLLAWLLEVAVAVPWQPHDLCLRVPLVVWLHLADHRNMCAL